MIELAGAKAKFSFCAAITGPPTCFTYIPVVPLPAVLRIAITRVVIGPGTSAWALVAPTRQASATSVMQPSRRARAA